jgi:hypothetical protein
MTGRDKCYSAAPPDKASLKTMTLPWNSINEIEAILESQWLQKKERDNA